MSLSMSQASQGKWETVPSKKDKEQGKKGKKTEMKVVQPMAAALSADQTMSAFAALDKWQRQREATESDEGEVTRVAVRTSGGYFTAEEEKNLTVKGKSKTQKAAPAQPKKPKVKKVKVTAKEIGEQLKASEIASQLSVLEKTYAESQVSQCEMLADFLWKTFKDADLPFNNLLTEQTSAKVADTPLQFVSKDVAGKLKDWVSARSPEALQQLVLNLVAAVFDGLPDFQRTSKQAPIQPPKAKVGLLLLLSVVLRAKPEVLLPLCPALLAKSSELTAPLRLPQTHWLLSQAVAAGHEGTAVAIHVWCSVVLPQALGTSLAAFREEPKKCTMMQKDSALASAAWLREVMGGIKSAGAADWFDVAMSSGISGLDGAAVPVVPTGAVDTAVRCLFGGDLEAGEPSTNPKGAASKPVREALEDVLSDLRELGVGGADPGTALSLALETAEGSSGAFEGAGSRLVAEAACSAVSALMASDAAFGKWEEKHKKMIKGSARILQHIAVEQPSAFSELLAAPGKARAFADLIKAIRSRHRSLLETGKGWQRACAIASEEAAASLGSSATKAARRSSSSVSSLFFTASAAAAAVAVIGVTVCSVAEPELAKLYAVRMGLPFETVDHVLGMVPPEYTTQLRAGLAAASSAVPPELLERIAPVLDSANQTLSAVAGQAGEVWRELIKQYSH